MREIAEQARVRSEASADCGAAVRPGGFNLVGTFFDPDGHPVERVGELSPGEARAAVAAGALLAFEGCGCGGSASGCEPEWASAEACSSLARGGAPRLVKGYGSPTWIDLWTGGTRSVVFLHGDVRWDDFGV